MAIDADLNAGQITDERGARAPRGDRARGRLLRRDGRRLEVRQGRRDRRHRDRRDQPDRRHRRRRAPAAACRSREAVHTFSLLTIGDGLAAQIPALLISTATGIIVTRSASDADLGRDISGQILRQPRAPMIAGGIIAAIGLVPGLPKLPFFIIGGIFFLLGRAMVTHAAEAARDAGRAGEQRSRRPPRQPGDAAVGALAIDPLELTIGFGLVPLVDAAQSGGSLLARVGVVRRQIASELGHRDRARCASTTTSRSTRTSTPSRCAASRSPAAAIIPGHRLAMNPGDATARPRRHPDHRARLRPAGRVDRGGRAAPRPRRSATRSSTPSR